MPRIDNPDWRLRSGHTAPKLVADPVLHPGELVIPQHRRLGLLNLGSYEPRLRLASYYDPATAQPPAAVSRPHPGYQWAMLANDRLGDCVIAAILHAINSWMLDTGGATIAFTDQDAILLYEKIGGYDPSDPSTDGGCDENVAMKDWEAGLPKTSDGVSHVLAAAVAVDPTNEQDVKIGIYEGGGIFDGIALPVSAQGQTEWQVVGDPNSDPNSAPGSWGGHATFTREYDPEDYRLITWGAEILESAAFRRAYHQQAFIVVPQDAEKKGVGPSGVHWDDLMSDIRKLGREAAEEEPDAPKRPRSRKVKDDAEESKPDEASAEGDADEDDGEPEQDGGDSDSE